MSYRQHGGPAPSLTFLFDSSPRASRVLSADSFSPPRQRPQSSSSVSPAAHEGLSGFVFPPIDPQRPVRGQRDSFATGRSEYTEFELTDNDSFAAQSEFAPSERRRASFSSTSYTASEFSFSSPKESLNSSARNNRVSGNLRRPAVPLFSAPSLPPPPRPAPPPLNVDTTHGRDYPQRPSLSNSVSADRLANPSNPARARLQALRTASDTTHRKTSDKRSGSPAYMKTFLEQNTPVSATFPSNNPFAVPVSIPINKSISSSTEVEYRNVAGVEPGTAIKQRPQVTILKGKDDADAERSASAASAASLNISPSTVQSQTSMTPVSAQEDASPHTQEESKLGEPFDDVTKVIASAGSAEAAVLKLLKEKHTATARSEQLWKLVEKQRAMILSLNKDLQRAFDEKDRYRRKYKDLATANGQIVPPTPTIDSYHSHTYSQHPGTERGDNRNSSAPKKQTSSQNSKNAALAVHKHKTSNPDSSSSSAGHAYRDVKAHNLIDSQSLREALATSDSDLEEALQLTPTPSQVAMSGTVYPAPLVLRSSNFSDSSSVRKPSISSPSSISSPGENKRKAPPPSLNLAQSPVSQMPVQKHEVSDFEVEEEEDDEEDSIYDGIPRFDRGRQRTREDDDRQREAIALIEERSRSKKEMKSQSKGKSGGSTGKQAPLGVTSGLKAQIIVSPPVKTIEVLPSPAPVTQTVQAPALSETAAGFAAGVGLPSSPRAALLGGLQSPMGQPVGSISAMLNARLNQPSSAPKHTELTMSGLKSPGLPMSPRPGDRPVNPPTPRLPKQPFGASQGPIQGIQGANGMPLSPRAPRQPIPLPPTNLMGINSPHLARAEAYSQQMPASTSLAERLQGRSTTSVEVLREEETDSAPHEGPVFRGLVSEQYPNLLLPPNALPVIYVCVHSSRLRPSRHTNNGDKIADEDSIITLAVHGRSDKLQLWRVEKNLAAMLVLHNKLKMTCDFQAKLPDKSLFSGHAPVKVDARRAALNQYFDMMLDTPMSEAAGLLVCEFFSSDYIGPHIENAPFKGLNTGPTNAAKKTPAPLIRRRKEGYLAKRGKQFGGWKARYFVLDGTELQYYESPGGTHLGRIRMQNAQIARQIGHVAATSEEHSEYRHAFIIFEPKRKDASSLVRHVLCAESDEERDSWVEALMPYVSAEQKITEEALEAALSGLAVQGAESPVKATAANPNSNPNSATADATAKPVHTSSSSAGAIDAGTVHAASNGLAKGSLRTRPAPTAEPQLQLQSAQQPGKYAIKPLHAASQDEAAASDAIATTAPHLRQHLHLHSSSSPHRGIDRADSFPSDEEVPAAPDSPRSKNQSSTTPSPSQQTAPAPGMFKAISGPIAGGPIQNLQAWGNRSPVIPGSKDGARDGSKKKGIFGFRTRGGEDESRSLHGPRGNGRNESVPRLFGGGAFRSRPVLPVFGMPLADAAENMPPVDIDICLPAPVYRCIEYLEAKNAAQEEGIFRLSGSNVVIKSLKERFNNEGDVLLLHSADSYDIHAIASLLKLYLRELPEAILTRELHLDFLRVLEVDEKREKLAAVNVLVHRLPEANYELLATLSRYLIDVVSNADFNKMNVRNVGIVFAPTLNIPAPLISYFITDHEAIFTSAIDPNTSLVIQDIETSPPASPDSATTPTGATIPDLRSPRKQMFTELPTPAFNQTTFQGIGRDGSGSQYTSQPTNHSQYSSDTSAPLRNGHHSNLSQQQQYHHHQQQQQQHHQQQSSALPHHQPTMSPYYRHYQPLMTQVPDQGGFGSLNAVLAPSHPHPTTSTSSSPKTTASSSTSSMTAPTTNTKTSRSSTPSAMSVAMSSSNSQQQHRGRDSPDASKSSNPSSNSTGLSVQPPSLEGRRKSSYQRLREIAGVKDDSSR